MNQNNAKRKKKQTKTKRCENDKQGHENETKLFLEMKTKPKCTTKRIVKQQNLLIVVKNMNI